MAGVETLSNADVVNLLVSGLDAQTVIYIIQNAKKQTFAFTVADYIELGKAKVPDGVISAMINRTLQVPNAV